MKEDFAKLTEVTQRELLHAFRSGRFNPELVQQESIEALIKRIQTGIDEPEDTEAESLNDIMARLRIEDDIEERVIFSADGISIDGASYAYAFESSSEETPGKYDQEREIVENAKTVGMKEAQQEHELAGVGLYKKTPPETTQ